MKIIDFDKKGNIVRFYLGEWTDEYGWTNQNHRDHYYTDDNPPKKENLYWGDDWNDTPYEHNAGSVYEKFVKGICDVVFPHDTLVLEPAEDQRFYGNSPYCKADFIERKVPCIIATKDYNYMNGLFLSLAASDSHNVAKFYFGDELEPTKDGEYYIWKWEGDK